MASFAWYGIHNYDEAVEFLAKDNDGWYRKLLAVDPRTRMVYMRRSVYNGVYSIRMRPDGSVQLLVPTNVGQWYVRELSNMLNVGLKGIRGVVYDMTNPLRMTPEKIQVCRKCHGVPFQEGRWVACRGCNKRDIKSYSDTEPEPDFLANLAMSDPRDVCQGCGKLQYNYDTRSYSIAKYPTGFVPMRKCWQCDGTGKFNYGNKPVYRAVQQGDVWKDRKYVANKPVGVVPTPDELEALRVSGAV